MKSIIKDMELGEKAERSFYVQISEGGRVNLSFDGNEASVQVSLTVKELQQYNVVIAEALHERQEQIKEELA